MKKYLVVLFLFFLGIVKVNAYGIEDYYIDYTVQTNGDVLVKEMFVLNGSFNGYERKIWYKNSNADTFDGTIESFRGSDIYNASDLDIIDIKYISLTKINNFSDLDKSEVNAERVNSATTGESGKYVITDHIDGYSLRMYNPSSYNNRAFYIEYLIKDVVILHNDVAEIGWNIFSDELDESIKNLVVRINLPGNKNEARIWGHGPLYGETSIESKDLMYLTIERLDANQAIDMRIVFDKEVASESLKRTGLNALPIILDIEEKLADEANKIREAAQRNEQIKRYFGYGFEVLKGVWLFGLFKRLKVIREKNKPYESSFKTKYFRDFPNDYNPTTVSFLFNKKVEKKDISASILDLVQRKVISYEKVDKKDYVFTRGKKEGNLSKSETYLLDFLFKEIGKEEKFTIKDINSYARKKSQDFLKKYDFWWTMATKEARDLGFFYDKTKEEKSAIVYASIGVLLVFASFAFVQILSGSLVLIFSLIAIIYLSSLNKRTRDANESYLRWIGLKNFLTDFGNFKERELPHIELWEKYLVYATVFGNAKKLAKQMEIKFKEMPDSPNLARNIIHFNTFNALNIALGSGLNASAATAQRIVTSAASSGGGFGGGFSGGGGSFGGGGGGGRF